MNRVAIAPIEGAAKTLTAFVVVLVVVVVPVLTALDEGGLRGPAIAAGIGVLLVGIGWAFAPSGYGIEDGTLVVHRYAFRPLRFDVSHAAIRPAGTGPRLTTVRLMGSGGMFGWYGTFWDRDRGRYYAYVTDRTRVVVLERLDEPDVLVSPEDPSALATRLKEHA